MCAFGPTAGQLLGSISRAGHSYNRLGQGLAGEATGRDGNRLAQERLLLGVQAIHELHMGIEKGPPSFSTL
jgi:hypothetical protein